jgi:hypothetical protein
MCVKLLTYQNYTKMHGQKYLNSTKQSPYWEGSCRSDALDKFPPFTEAYPENSSPKK